MSKVKTKRHGAGEYEVSDGAHSVRITQVELDDGKWWIAAALWNNFLYSDPLWTKRDAMKCALSMLDDPYFEKYYANQAKQAQSE